MRTTSVYGLNLPEESDYYNVDDYNGNFEVIENTMSVKFAEIMGRIDFVTGIMTANGTMDLGWQPRAVFVMCSDSSDATANSFNYSRVFNGIAFALINFPYKSGGVARLTITPSGFTTNGMFGYPSSSSSLDMNAYLRYIAFK
ncbi:MAG: hypothetical protein LBI38_03610 [Oscillospiraceae bacterium]|jgi:hypothetical protein|nr:hypothetical protein [Oscillospiraceae bacterium]